LTALTSNGKEKRKEVSLQTLSNWGRGSGSAFYVQRGVIKGRTVQFHCPKRKRATKGDQERILGSTSKKNRGGEEGGVLSKKKGGKEAHAASPLFSAGERQVVGRKKKVN